jgi:hypothetical protein
MVDLRISKISRTSMWWCRRCASEMEQRAESRERERERERARERAREK